MIFDLDRNFEEWIYIDEEDDKVKISLPGTGAEWYDAAILLSVEETKQLVEALGEYLNGQTQEKKCEGHRQRDRAPDCPEDPGQGSQVPQG